MDAREALDVLDEFIKDPTFFRMAGKAIAVLRKVVEAQERHDEAGEGRRSAELADGAMRRNGEADTPDAPSPGLSIDDERALESIIIRDKHDLPDWHLTFATRDYLRSRLYAPKVRVTRRDLDSLLIMLIDCGPLWYRGTMPEEGRVISILSGWLRSIGLSVDDGQEKGRER